MVAAALVAGCNPAIYAEGPVERAGALSSRAYDCGLRPNRAALVRAVTTQVPQEEKASVAPRFREANASYAVRSYIAPKSCDGGERDQVARELRNLSALAPERSRRPMSTPLDDGSFRTASR